MPNFDKTGPEGVGSTGRMLGGCTPSLNKQKEERMKIVITSEGKDFSALVDQKFGRAKYLMVVDLENNSIVDVYDNKENMGASSGAGVQTSQKIDELSIKNVITGSKVGPRAFRVLKASRIKVWLTKQTTIKEAVEKYKDEKLELMSE